MEVVCFFAPLRVGWYQKCEARYIYAGLTENNIGTVVNRLVG